MRLKTFHRALLLTLSAVVAIAALWWKCRRDPAVNFLPGDGRAEWILFPTAVDARSHPVAMMDATFRRTFALEAAPKSARLEVRAAKRTELRINSETVSIESPNWKQMSILDVSRFLHAGENKIEARVFNDNAPPALWLNLTADSQTLRSDNKWEVSLAGSSWRGCALASVARRPGLGNLLAGGEKIADVLPRLWREWIVFGTLAVLLAFACERWLRNDVDLSSRQAFGLIGICILSWLFLFLNNARMLSFYAGYDVNDHVAYIKYIQDRGALPLPNEGYEMFQPPLFYALSAGLLSILHLSAGDAAAITVLRGMTMFFGVVNFIFVFLSLRLLFPGRAMTQLIGLITAAFLPMQLYLSHYVTNETLASTLASISIYLGLRVLITEPAPVWELLALGTAVGAAVLAKATDILLIPPLLGAVGIKLLRSRAKVVDWTRAFGVIIAAMLVVCGWHYLRIWHHFGTPIVGNWDPILGFPWWQDPGFHTSSDYFRFGQSLMNPLFCSFNGFADGIYSTLWGDSLGGGLSALLSRTPWNYNLVIGGYWLALLPTLLVILGVAIALFRLARQISAEWFLLLGLSVAIVIALTFMTLKVPSYAQVKAFYGLAALVPFCAFAVVGWQVFPRRARTLRLILTAFPIFIALNNFASVWIRQSSELRIYSALRWIAEPDRGRAVSEATAAVKSDPSSAMASYILAAILDEAGETTKAIAQSEHGLELDPANGYCRFQLALGLARQGQSIRALSEVQRAVELLPEHVQAHALMLSLVVEQHLSREALAIGRDALVLSPFDSELHYRVGLIAGELDDLKTATHQFAYAFMLAPKVSKPADKLRQTIRFTMQRPDASFQLREVASDAPDSPALLNELAWIFATDQDPNLRDGAEAIRLSERACVLTKRQRATFVLTLAAAYAEAGRFSEAVNTAGEALSLARSANETSTSALAENLLSLVQNQQPYRAEPIP
ncbi:MAG: glycosyltransferase family 39 protein [Verrucomicrobia bacterium]|nr:glycosyltransferase family 39 protein [Verrucomicrobiota bacterium]